jgi:hypothetical protein
MEIRFNVKYFSGRIKLSTIQINVIAPNESEIIKKNVFREILEKLKDESDDNDELDFIQFITIQEIDNDNN